MINSLFKGLWELFLLEIMYPESADIGYKMGSHPSSEENIFVPIRAAFDLGNN